MSRGVDLLLAAWFVLVAVSFWGPYLAVPLPVSVATALYAVFLLVAVAALALRLLKRDGTGASGKQEESLGE